MSTRGPSFPHANVLVLGLDSVQALLPSSLISQADFLLLNHRVEDAAELADQQRKSLQSMMIMDPHELNELHYIYQRIGLQCLTETLFEDAGKHLFEGELDPRVLISYYPDLCSSLFDDLSSVDVFAGVSEHLPPEESIEEIIRNYSPHLSPNTREAPVTVELRDVLIITARDMLEHFLRKWRTKAKLEGPERLANAPEVRMAVDTVLAKLLVAHDKLEELNLIIDEPNFIYLPEVEAILQASHQYHVLCKLYWQRGEYQRLLETWSKLVDGEWVDAKVQDPLSSMVALLSDRRDPKLTQQWGIWMTKRDPERALKLLTSTAAGKRKAEDDRILLQQLRDVNPSAGAQFLEHLVLQRRSIDTELHMQLAVVYVEQLLSCLADESISKLWRAKAASYASNRSDTSFLSYFASTTPDSESKRTRLKTALFLQGSTLYSPQPIRDRFAEHEKILRFEMAIVDGKLGQHRSALTSLVHELHDTTSAEIYCTLGGEIVPAKMAQSLGERFGLQLWASLLAPPANAKGKVGAVPMSRIATVDSDLKKSLIGVLLEVYMSGGERTAERTARFLNAQAMNLDVFDVISLIPPDWPIHTLSTFAARSLRRTLHARHEGQIVKAISAGQNLAVAESTWLVQREQGAIIEEAVEGDDDEVGDGEKLNERGTAISYDEKAIMLQQDVEPILPEAQTMHGGRHAKEAVTLNPPYPDSEAEVGA